jgi:hypothetical protein
MVTTTTVDLPASLPRSYAEPLPTLSVVRSLPPLLLGYYRKLKSQNTLWACLEKMDTNSGGFDV